MPGAELFRQNLERLILDFLEEQQMSVLATCADAVPRASVVEFFPRGFVLYVLTEGGRKMHNLSKNPSSPLLSTRSLPAGTASEASRSPA